jgi:hypothetical protein
VLVVVFSAVGAAVAIINAVAVFAWLASPLRGRLFSALPFSAAEVEPWLEELRLAAAADVLALIAAGLWVVLVMRLGIPGWLRGLAATAGFAAFIVAAVAAAMSSVTVAQLTTPRTLVDWRTEAGNAPRLIVGRDEGGRLVTLVGHGGGELAVELSAPPEAIAVRGRQTVPAFARGHIGYEQRD